MRLIGPAFAALVREDGERLKGLTLTVLASPVDDRVTGLVLDRVGAVRLIGLMLVALESATVERLIVLILAVLVRPAS